MATLMQNIMQGGAKKAFAGSIGAVLSSEVISPWVDWAFRIIEQKGLDVPDPVEASANVIIIAIFGFLISLLAPANKVETVSGALVKPEDAKITKA